MKFNKHLLMITGVLAVMLVLAGCGNNSSSTKSSKQMAKDQTINLSTSSEISTLDIAKASDSGSLTPLYQISEGIYRLGPKSKIENALATSTKVSNDGLTYTFKLRTNDKWNNGQPVTAKDFVYGWRRVVNPKTAAGYSYLFEGVKNYSAIQKGHLSANKLGVYAPNSHTLVVKLSHPVPYFKLLLAFPTFFPQQESAVKKYGSRYGTSSATTAYNGPFVLSKWNGTSDTWTMTKNPNYWDKKHVKAHQLDFQVIKTPSTGLSLYQQNKLDVISLSGEEVPTYKNRPEFKKFVGGSTMYLEMNQKRVKALKNTKVRQALSRIINKQTLASQVLRDGSTAPKGFVSTNFFRNPKTGADFAKDAYEKDGVAYNQSQAKKLWQQGMKQVGQKKLHLSLLSDDTDQSKKTTQYLQSQFNKLPGLSITIHNVPTKSKLSRSTSGDFDLVVSSWGADFADPINFLNLLTKSNPTNNGHWVNATYDKYIEASKTTDANNPDKRYDDLVNAEKVLMKDQGIVPLYQPATTQLWRTNIHGFVWNPAGMSNGYKGLYVTK